MNTLRDAAQQALKAMRLAASNHDVMLLSDPPQDAWKARNVAGELSAALTALEAALAEPKSEPVAPPQRQPLSDEQISGLELPKDGTCTMRDLVRIIERAHNIGGDK